MSPLSFGLIFEIMKMNLSESVSYKEGLYNEYNAHMGFFESPEFTEGARAKLVDRDNNPKWSHRSVYDVSEEDIYFFTKRKVPDTLEAVYDLDSFPYWDSLDDDDWHKKLY